MASNPLLAELSAPVTEAVPVKQSSPPPNPMATTRGGTFVRGHRYVSSRCTSGLILSIHLSVDIYLTSKRDFLCSRSHSAGPVLSREFLRKSLKKPSVGSTLKEESSEL